MPVSIDLRPKSKSPQTGVRATFPVFVTLALDPAVSSKKRADASGITVVANDPVDTWWLFEADDFRGEPNAVIERLMLYAMKYRPQIISIEKVAFSYLYRDLLVPRLDDAGLMCQVVEYTEAQRVTKHTRISALQPRFRQGKIRIRAGLDRMIYELENYAGPDSLDHEDLLDSLAQHIPISRPASLTETAEIVYREEVPPSKRNERRMGTDDRLDGTFTGGRDLT